MTIRIVAFVTAVLCVAGRSEAAERVLLRRTFSVPPGAYFVQPFVVPSPLQNGRVAGNFSARGGSGNDIAVYLFNDVGYREFVAGRPSPALYETGKRRSAVITIPVSEADSYFLVFDNRFSILSQKQVRAEISLVYDALDLERAAQLTERDKRRRERLGSILGKLAEALQRQERIWGTKQIQGPIRLAISKESTINAGAYHGAKLIVVNEGLIHFAESIPEMTDHILAGVLGHELAHVFYRHTRGSRDGQIAETIGIGAVGMSVHPLVAVMAGALAMDRHLRYDRMEESEADVLGLHLSCDAKFDPVGLLVFLQKLASTSPRGDFLQTHPSPQNREESLRTEAGHCFGKTPQEQLTKNELRQQVPVVVYNPAPTYTERALQNRVSGVVLLQCTVDIDGRARDFKVLRGLGYGLDESAIQTVQNLWRFRPAKVGDHAISTVIAIEVNFVLTK